MPYALQSMNRLRIRQAVHKAAQLASTTDRINELERRETGWLRALPSRRTSE